MSQSVQSRHTQTTSQSQPLWLPRLTILFGALFAALGILAGLSRIG